MRKHVLEYDDVMNKHREVIYRRRNKILDNENIHEDIKKMISSQISILVNSEFTKETQNIKDLIKKINSFLEIEAIDTKVEMDDVE
jgi:protein translocase subunit secA